MEEGVYKTKSGKKIKQEKMIFFRRTYWVYCLIKQDKGAGIHVKNVQLVCQKQNRILQARMESMGKEDIDKLERIAMNFTSKICLEKLTV